PPGTAGPAPDAAVTDRTARLAVPPAPHARAGVRERMPRRPVLALVTALLLALGIGVGVWYINAGQFTKVPAVLDLPQKDAEDKLRDAGLGVRTEAEYSDVVDKGKVISTDPGVGARIRDTGTVTLHVSQGPERAEVPNVVGMRLAEAKARIADAGLSVGTVTQRFSEETAQGAVLSTRPGAGVERRPDTPVEIVVSRGSPVDVPDVLGESVDEATSDLRASGFKVRIARERVFSDEDPGAVARQSPSGDTQAASGDTVTLTLSKGPEMVRVPDVTGKKVDEAQEELEAAGFEVRVDRPLFFPGDTVDSQSVDGGDEAPKNSTITIKVKGAF
ncbi:PASTA domain-containing protein, partial [Streptomyces sp. B1866]|uniref:Stk1 family PASTA domain-containing Ser/Thr kinase n=1 Tax=Streptomyces sp. B1866 TaxID=3075431 RepID=UPI00288DAAC8